MYKLVRHPSSGTLESFNPHLNVLHADVGWRKGGVAIIAHSIASKVCAFLMHSQQQHAKIHISQRIFLLANSIDLTLRLYITFLLNIRLFVIKHFVIPIYYSHLWRFQGLSSGADNATRHIVPDCSERLILWKCGRLVVTNPPLLQIAFNCMAFKFAL